MRKTREIAWRIGAAVARVRVPRFSARQSSPKLDTARFICILRITMEKTIC